MSHDDHAAPGMAGFIDEPAIHGIIQGALLAPSEGTGEGPGAQGSAGDAGRRNDWNDRLSYYTKRGIEASAAAAYRDNRRPVDACPYRPDFAPLEFEHWKACFLLEGGVW